MTSAAVEQSWREPVTEQESEPSPVTAPPKEPAQKSFIPISRTDVLNALLNPEMWSSQDNRTLAADVLHKIGLIRQHRSAVTLNELSELYDTFNPDDETVNIVEPSAEKRLEQRRAFNNRLEELVTSANFHQLSHDEFEEVLNVASPDGVHVDVDFDEYDVKLMFYRGESTAEHKKRDMWKLYLKHITYKVQTFDRLFLAIKFKPEELRVQEIMNQQRLDEAKARKKVQKARRMLPPSVSTDHIYIKVFKDIPRYDVEMLFPNIRVKMKFMDKVRLGGSAVAGLLTWAIGTASKLLVAVALSPIMLAGALLTGVGGVMYAQIRNIFITRDKYRMQLAQSLYFQNLANNQGALALMIDEAEEEDVKEEALLYMHLLPAPVPMSEIEDLRARIDGFLHEHFAIDIRFDIHDALERLIALGLVKKSADGELHALSLEDANRHLMDYWCGLAMEHR